jgi:hypothetical protein
MSKRLFGVIALLLLASGAVADQSLDQSIKDV